MQHLCEAAGTVAAATVAAARGGRAVLTADHLPGHSSVSFPSHPVPLPPRAGTTVPPPTPTPPPQALPASPHKPPLPTCLVSLSPPPSASPPPPAPYPLTLRPLTQSSPPRLSPSLWLAFSCSLSQILPLPGLSAFPVLPNSLSPFLWSDFPAASFPALSPLCPFSFSSLSLWLCIFSTSNSLQLGFPVPSRLLFSLSEA